MTALKRISALGAATVAATALLLGAALVGPQLAQAEDYAGPGTWRTQSSSFKIPSNWKCQTSTMSYDRRSVAQNCLVRSGNYVQSALIVRNLTGSNFSTSASTYLINHNDWYRWDCPASSLAPRGLSVCFGATKYKPKLQQVGGQWLSGGEQRAAKEYYEK